MQAQRGAQQQPPVRGSWLQQQQRLARSVPQLPAWRWHQACGSSAAVHPRARPRDAAWHRRHAAAPAADQAGRERRAKLQPPTLPSVPRRYQARKRRRERDAPRPTARQHLRRSLPVKQALSWARRVCKRRAGERTSKAAISRMVLLTSVLPATRSSSSAAPPTPAATRTSRCVSSSARRTNTASATSAGVAAPGAARANAQATRRAAARVRHRLACSPAAPRSTFQKAEASTPSDCEGSACASTSSSLRARRDTGRASVAQPCFVVAEVSAARTVRRFLKARHDQALQTPSQRCCRTARSTQRSALRLTGCRRRRARQRAPARRRRLRLSRQQAVRARCAASPPRRP